MEDFLALRRTIHACSDLLCLLTLVLGPPNDTYTYEATQSTAHDDRQRLILTNFLGRSLLAYRVSFTILIRRLEIKPPGSPTTERA